MLDIRQFEEITQIMMCPDTGNRLKYWASTYLIDGLLIDTGPAYTAFELAHYLRDCAPTIVVNTHHHEDHIGGNRLLGKTFDVEFFAHPLSIPFIENPPKLSLYGKKMWGEPEGSTVRPVSDEIRTSNFTFKVLETNGHCPGHICLVEPSRGWVFTGDLYMGSRFRTLGIESNVSEMICSMKTLIQYPSERLVLLTSMRTVEKDGRKALAACVNRLELLISEASKLQREGRSVSEIVDLLFGGESIFYRTTGGMYSTRRFVEKLLECQAPQEQKLVKPA
jgi:glyoxylase-like metal-dependent hydrolase (beta-lactamase superfamily II)